jgi:hypothetical protein
VSEPSVYNHSGHLIFVTERPKFWEADIKLGTQLVAYIVKAKVGLDPLDDLLLECSAVIDGGCSRPRRIDARVARMKSRIEA